MKRFSFSNGYRCTLGKILEQLGKVIVTFQEKILNPNTMSMSN